MIKVRRLGHATLATPDLDAQTDYYSRLLGLSVIENVEFSAMVHWPRLDQAGIRALAQALLAPESVPHRMLTAERRRLGDRRSAGHTATRSRPRSGSPGEAPRSRSPGRIARGIPKTTPSARPFMNTFPWRSTRRRQTSNAPQDY